MKNQFIKLMIYNKRNLNKNQIHINMILTLIKTNQSNLIVFMLYIYIYMF